MSKPLMLSESIFERSSIRPVSNIHAFIQPIAHQRPVTATSCDIP
ncbi:hypothetical protein QT976_04150 [Microcoleus sp. w2-18aC6]